MIASSTEATSYSWSTSMMQFLWDPDSSAIDKCKEDTKDFFSMQDEGDISDYLGIKVSKLPNGTIKLAQPQLFDSILSNLHYAENTKFKPTPAPSSTHSTDPLICPPKHTIIIKAANMTWRPLKNKKNQRHRVSQRIQTKIFTECGSNDV